MGKEKGFALTALKAKDVRRWLEARGYTVEPGKHRSEGSASTQPGKV